MPQSVRLGFVGLQPASASTSPYPAPHDEPVNLLSYLSSKAKVPVYPEPTPVKDPFEGSRLVVFRGNRGSSRRGRDRHGSHNHQPRLLPSVQEVQLLHGFSDGEVPLLLGSSDGEVPLLLGSSDGEAPLEPPLLAWDGVPPLLACAGQAGWCKSRSL